MSSAFSPEIYRRYNFDLSDMTDEELAEHFRLHQHEPRIHAAASSTVEALSMRWLRGDGIEIGAGARPTPLYGNATVLKSDSDRQLTFGGDAIDIQAAIDDPQFAAAHRGRFDFAVASHVLEHADSFLRAVETMLSITRADGIVYIVLPDMNGGRDKDWIPDFDFVHHLDEYRDPLVHAGLHDRLFVEGNAMRHPENYANAMHVYEQMVASRKVAPNLRFLYHKHSYAFDGWLRLFIAAQDFFAQRFRLVDVRFGHERSDCHFVLKVI